MNLTFKLQKNFTIMPYRFMKRAEYTFEPVLDLYARKFRKMALDHSLLQKHKVLIPANRTRLPEDTLIRLKGTQETAGVILAREEFPDVNFVVDQRQCFTLKKMRHPMVQNYYVRIPETEEMIRVTLNNMENYEENNWIPWIHFNRYIVGRPNLLFIPIKIRRGFSNVTINQGGNMYQKINGIHVYSYNDDYPTTFEIDPYNVTPARGYKLGDLVNILPDGMVIHPKYKNSFTGNIFYLKPNNTKAMIEKVKQETRLKRMNAAQTIEELNAAAQEKEEDLDTDVKKGPKTLFDKIVDKQSIVEDEEIDDADFVEEPKTQSELKREELIRKKKELKKKMGKKTPFSNLKKTILEEYTLKENFKERQETKDKKGGGDKAGGDTASGK